jgi:hypothetical protein
MAPHPAVAVPETFGPRGTGKRGREFESADRGFFKKILDNGNCVVSVFSIHVHIRIRSDEI